MRVLGQMVFHQPAQCELGGIGQVGHGQVVLPEAVQRLPLCRRPRNGHQPVGRHRDMHELARIQPYRQRRVVVHEREVGFTPFQQRHGVCQGAGAYAQLGVLQNGLQPHQPVGHHRACQRAAGGQRHGAGLPPGQALQLLVRLRQAARHVARSFQKALPGRRQGDGAATALHQRRTRPGLQRADAAAKGGVRDMPQLGCTRVAALLRQHDEVFEPLELHGCDPGAAGARRL